MISLNKAAYGGTLRVNFDRDVSAATSYAMYVEPERGDDERALTPVTLGTSDVQQGNQLLLANQYIEYTTQEGDFTEYVGLWRVRGTALLSTGEKVATNYKLFNVSE